MILPWLILIPFIGGLLCWLGERFGSTLPRWIALLTMSLLLGIGLWLWANGDYTLAPAPGAAPQWAVEFKVLWIERFGISLHLALDGLSLLMILLTGLLGVLSALITAVTRIRYLLTDNLYPQQELPSQIRSRT